MFPNGQREFAINYNTLTLGSTLSFPSINSVIPQTIASARSGLLPGRSGARRGTYARARSPSRGGAAVA